MKLFTSMIAVTATGIASVLTGGCCSCYNQPGPGHCADVPRGALPEPLGAHVHRFEDAQSKNAQAEQFVIYTNEWYMGGKELGPYGEYHVQQIAKRMPSVSCTVYVQPTLNSQLNDERRRDVIMRLLAGGVGDAEHRVKIGFPDPDSAPAEVITHVQAQAH